MNSPVSSSLLSAALSVEYASCKKKRRRRASCCASLYFLSMVEPARASHIHDAIDRTSLQTTTKRTLQGKGLVIGGAVDVQSCYADLHAADVNSDGKLSPNEFLTFAQASADGLLDANEWGMPIIEFSNLPSEYIGIYNLFACGDANYGCPSVAGIGIDGVTATVNGESGGLSSQQETSLFQLCKKMEQERNNLTPKTTGGPTVSVELSAPAFQNAPKAPTSSPLSTITVPPTTPCPPLYEADTLYDAGDLVSVGGLYYQCKSGQESRWCRQAAYAPGNNIVDSTRAWTFMGECTRGAPEELYYNERWADLPQEIQDGYTVLGFNETLWNEGLSTEYDNLTWDELSPEMKEAAISIGYTEEIWCAADAGVATPKGTFPTNPPTVFDVGEVTTTSPPSKITPAGVTLSPTSKPTSAIVAAAMPPAATKPVGYGGEKPYSGPLSTTFQYEIYNARNLDAWDIKADSDVMAVLLETTTKFVEAVVADTFGQSDNVSAHATKTRLDPKPSLNDQGGLRRRIHRRSHHRLEVHLQQNQVTIVNVEDVECSDPSPTPDTASGDDGCQQVTAWTVLTLVNEPKNFTMLQFQMAVSTALVDPCAHPSPTPARTSGDDGCQKVTSGTVFTTANEPEKMRMLDFHTAVLKALVDPGMTFPQESGIVYVGPSVESTVSFVPEMARPREESDTPGWVVPLSVGAAGVGLVMLLLLLSYQRRKRRKTIKQWGYSRNSPHPRALENDILGGPTDGEESSFDEDESSFEEEESSFDGEESSYETEESSYETEVKLNHQNIGNPLNANSSPHGNGTDRERHQRRSSSSNPYPDSSSRNSSLPSGSYSSHSISTRSSVDDISDNNSVPEGPNSQNSVPSWTTVDLY